jgi:hypothetical protein
MKNKAKSVYRSMPIGGARGSSDDSVTNSQSNVANDARPRAGSKYRRSSAFIGGCFGLAGYDRHSSALIDGFGATK